MENEIRASLILKPGKEKAIKQRHPWIFSGAIKEIINKPASGDLVLIYSSTGDILGIGAYSQISQIICRIWKFTSDKKNLNINNHLSEKIHSAINLRNDLKLENSTNAYRLAHAESDSLPGLIIDLYKETAIIQLLSYGVEPHREAITKILFSQPFINSVDERSDAEVRTLEGLEAKKGHLAGEVLEQNLVTIRENGIFYKCSLVDGQKTGFYLDQRENRFLMQGISKNKEILDCFCYTGGFSLNAYLGGAKHITSVDISDESLGLFAENIALNQLDVSRFDLICNDVFKQLRVFRDQGRKFDLIVLDPPKFAPTRKQVQRASRGYKDINLLAIKLLRPGGILLTFSCSGGIDASLFQKIVAGAAEDAQEDVKIIRRLTQAPDHPVLLSFPEGEYLKGLVCIKT